MGSPLQATVVALAGASLAAAALLAAPAGGEEAPSSCRARIAAVLETILARNLDTSSGPPFNAFQSLNASAVAQAEALDRAVAAGARPGALHCLPLAVKDNVASFDLPMTVGSLALLGNQPERDAALLARLRAAGAIVVGKTTMDEFAFGIRGLSGAAGRTGNAVDPWNSPGGSSSGSGVAVGAGWVPMAVGSDNCGSLRLPAVYNGAVSLRPTQDRFDSDGFFPIGFVNGTPGLIACDLPTLEAGLAVIADPWRQATAQQGDALRGRRLAVLRRAGSASLEPTEAEASQALEEGMALLRAAGADVVEPVELASFDPRLGPDFLRGAAARIDTLLASYPASRRSWAEVCRSGRIPPDWTTASCLELFRSDAAAVARVREVVRTNRRMLETLLAERRLDGLVLLPYRRGAARREASEAFTCFVSSNAGVPAVVLPIRLDGRGMPIGLEILGRAGMDEELVAMAAALEKQRGPLPLRPAGAVRREGESGDSPLGIAAHNSLVSALGWRARRSRGGEALGDLDPARFRRLTQELRRRWSETGMKPPGKAI
jgi:Asp-tRNA(Asn)/Glu-tRNA(Gln) amidotransferase A subunit family amidase